MAKVEVDTAACQGYANCMVAMAEVFDLSDDGKVVVLPVDLDNVDQAQLAGAVASCPASALRLVDEQ